MSAVEIFGRDSWLERLTALPPVTLLHAPPSTGKRTVALHVSTRAGVAPVDVRFWPEPELLDEYDRPIDPLNDKAVVMSRREPPLSAEMVRQIVAWSHSTPLVSRVKVAIVRLSHTTEIGEEWWASHQLCASLLKTLEEPPASMRFILLATRPVPTMIRSRALELTGGLLSQTSLSRILVQVTDLTPFEAEAAARFGAGRVSQAVRMKTCAETSIGAVVDVLTYLATRDQLALTEKGRSWTDADTAMLLQWAHERITGRWSFFAGSGAPELSQLAAQRVLSAVSRVRDARPRIVLGAVAALAAA